jgi:serine/threonine protein kinase/tetratricopeptide (TPR) repeat protein
MKPASSEQAVFTEALRRSTPEARAAYLDGACGTDTALRQRVEALLRATERAGDFLEIPPTGLGGAPDSALLVGELSHKPGDRIGRYKLLEQIGEGGCGVVFMAEQQEPVRRRVALKVIKLGMDTKSVIARFEAERQALALMNHPNIAKVLDAGATDTGRPFFVMELVRGIKITDYCDQNNLSTEERLKLFTQVCQAIQHAHQKGIIHRDIKPSNILVTVSEPGAPGSPKVIDFGIAKATTGQRLTDKTVFTAFEQFIGTPAYMSPEQAMMTSLDIDTRTDIYALGVLLYELLTGQTPFDAKDLMAVGLDAMRRIIREQEPARPSTRLSTLLGDDLTIVARHRHAEPGRLGTLLRGDLDWIVMKALEKDRTRRYETANGLAMDIQRHLSSEPVVARPPSTGYRLQKMVRRNKLAFAAAGAVTAALIMGLGLSTWLFLRERAALKVAAENALRAERSRQKAEANEKKAASEAAKSRRVAHFLQDMLRGVSPWVAKGRDTTILREVLDKTAGRIGNSLTNEPEVELELRNTIGEIYRQLGQAKKAEAVLIATPDIARKLWGNESLQVADSLQNLALALGDQGKQAEAETRLREVLTLRRKLLGNEHPAVATAMHDLANALYYEGKRDEGEAMQRDALEMRRKLPASEVGGVAVSLRNLATMMRDQGRLAEAEPLYRESLAIYRKLWGSSENPDVAIGLERLAGVLRQQGKLAEAESVYREALPMCRKFFGDESNELRWAVGGLADVLKRQGKLAEAEKIAAASKP